MKTMRFLSMAALALMGVVMTGCSSDDNSIIDTPQQPVSSGNIVTVKTTISIDDSSDESGNNEGGKTRALTWHMDGTKLVKRFKAGEQLAVIYTNTNGETVKATSEELTSGDIIDDKTANFTVTLANPKAGTVEYVYPAPMANDDGTEASILSQDGTKATLERNFDYAKGSGTMTVEGSTATLPTITLTNRFAICAFNIKDIDKVSTLNNDFSQLTLTAGSDIYTITAPGGGNFNDTYIYVAMKPVTTALVATITNGTHTFTKTLTNRTYAANNVYQINMSYPVKNINKSSASIPNNTTWLIIGTGSETPNTITIGAGATANLSGVNISSASGSAITCSGNATINLLEGTTNRANGTCGIRIGGSGTTLTINGPGTLYAQSGEYGAAGIGGTDKAVVGNIVINGGEIHATGGYYAAGIGSGHGTYTDAASCGTITIHGGTVEARGGDSGAGIGGGAGRSSYSSITIDGGNVSAYGGAENYGAGIGSGGSNTSAGPITISGASTVVNATGATYAAGIGSGQDATCGNITISGGNITANAGEYGAGIGAGSDARCGNILINGGTIRAWYYDPYDMGDLWADGIGTADGGTCGNITITSAVTEVRTNSAIGGEHVPEGCDYDYCTGSHGTVTVDWSKVFRDWPY